MCTQACVCVHACVCMCAYVCVCAYGYVYVCVRACVCMCELSLMCCAACSKLQAPQCSSPQHTRTSQHSQAHARACKRTYTYTHLNVAVQHTHAHSQHSQAHARACKRTYTYTYTYTHLNVATAVEWGCASAILPQLQRDLKALKVWSKV